MNELLERVLDGFDLSEAQRSERHDPVDVTDGCRP